MLFIQVALFTLLAADWTQFRGPNAAGVAADANLPIEFGPTKNRVWSTPLPPGHSSPVLTDDSIFVTAFDGPDLVTIALDRSTGRVKWRRPAPRSRSMDLHKANSPASPSPVTDGRNVWVFFGDYGLISYGPDGNERWKHPLGPFNNPFGMGASPVLSGRVLIQSCDSETGSFVIAVDKDSGKQLWRVERPEFSRGFSTPVLRKGADGRMEAIIAGSYQLTAYDVETGKARWWTSGLTWQLKPTPVLGDNMIYVQNWAGGSDTGQQEDVMPFDEVLKLKDGDKSGTLSKQEIADDKLTRDWRAMDLDNDGVVGARDWQHYRSRRRAVNAVVAFKLGGSGDITETAPAWKYYKSLPNVPSPLLYQGILYMLKEGGILTALDAKTGEVLKQGRLTGAPGDYFSSPVASGGRIYTISLDGKATVLRAGSDWEILAVNDLADGNNATPAIADGKMYIRTHGAIACYAKLQ